MADETDDAVRWGRADLALMRRAARERWGVPDRLRTEALFQVARILADPEADPRHRLAAIKLLATLDRLDQLDDRLDLDKSRTEKSTDPDARAALLLQALEITRERRGEDGRAGPDA